jgi:hypothetical protein
MLLLRLNKVSTLPLIFNGLKVLKADHTKHIVIILKRTCIVLTLEAIQITLDAFHVPHNTAQEKNEML